MQFQDKEQDLARYLHNPQNSYHFFPKRHTLIVFISLHACNRKLLLHASITQKANNSKHWLVKEAPHTLWVAVDSVENPGES